MRHLDLFSGIGGFALAAKWVGWETVGFCEIEPYCQKVLRKHWPDVPIYDDVRELTSETVGSVDIITGGYPCQPFSVAGKRRGEADDRHLWPEFARLIREIRPRWVLGENVAGHITMGLDDVLADLEGLGYTWETFVIPACAVNAPHRRDRVWIAANRIGDGIRPDARTQSRTETEREELQQKDGQALSGDSESACEVVPNTIRIECESGTGRRRIRKSDSTVAHAGSDRYEGKCDRRNAGIATNNESRSEATRSRDASLFNANNPTPTRQREHGGEVHAKSETTRFDDRGSEEWWAVEPDICRVVDGIPKRVDRLRGLGNAIVPQVAEVIFRAIVQTEHGQ